MLKMKLFSFPSTLCFKIKENILINNFLLKAAFTSSSVTNFFGFSKKTRTKKLVPANRIKGIEKSVWVEFTELALQHKPLNLGQGFPDFAAPEYVTKSLAKATLSENVLLNQYTRGFGHPRLVNILAKFYSKLINRKICPQKEVLVTVGAFEAIYCALLGNVNPGDEVIIIEPFYDCYEPMVRMAEGIPVFIPLKPTEKNVTISSGKWLLDPKELESKFSNKTKAIILNNPNNPLGKVYTEAELKMIGNLAKKYDAIIIMDEVYEWLIYDGRKHIRMVTLPDMWDRTITIGSAGKTFSVTGWKIGWVYGPAHLLHNLQVIHQNTVFTCATPLQEAVAEGFELEIDRIGKPECYYTELATMLEQKRDKLVEILENARMAPVIPEGGYFMIANYTELGKTVNFESKAKESRDYKFVKWMIKEKKLAGIPPTAFYSAEHKDLVEDYIRFCFIKEDSTLNKAEEILKQMVKPKGK